MNCEVPKCGHDSNVTVYYYAGCHWTYGIRICEVHRSEDCDKYPAPPLDSKVLAEHRLIKVMAIKEGKWVVINNGPVYPTADKISGKYTGYTDNYPKEILQLYESTSGKPWGLMNCSSEIQYGKRPEIETKHDPIEQIVELIKNGIVSKEQILKLADNNNILSVIVQINAKLKRLGLKLKKKKINGVVHYGTK